MLKQDQQRALDEIYRDIPVNELSEEDVNDLFRQFEEFLKNDEMSSLDLDYGLE